MDGHKGSAKRSYRSPRRAQQAADTRRAVLTAARDLFVEQGYPATTVADIASRAGVAVDTVYGAVGRKPVLLRETVEASISGQGMAVPAEEREYVLRVHAAPTADEKIRIYAHAISRIQPRLAPIFLALRDAAPDDPECAELWKQIADRRAANMRLFIAELSQTGELRDDVGQDELADAVWSMNGPEYWLLLVGQRGWTPDRFAGWLADAWSRLLLVPPQSAVAGAGPLA